MGKSEDCAPWVSSFCMMRNKKADPPSTVGGLEGIDKRVGSWGKKKKKRKKEKKKVKPMDCVPWGIFGIL